MFKRKINKLGAIALSAIIIFSGSISVFADEVKATESVIEHAERVVEYVPSDEECAVTKIINNIEDDTKRKIIFDFWTTPAFLVEGDSDTNKHLNDVANTDLIETYTYLASLSVSKLEKELNLIKENTYQELKSIPLLKVSKIEEKSLENINDNVINNIDINSINVKSSKTGSIGYAVKNSSNKFLYGIDCFVLWSYSNGVINYLAPDTSASADQTLNWYVACDPYGDESLEENNTIGVVNKFCRFNGPQGVSTMHVGGIFYPNGKYSKTHDVY